MEKATLGFHIFKIWSSNFFPEDKSYFVHEKPKIKKISGFEIFEIAKTGQISPFWRNPLCGQKRL